MPSLRETARLSGWPDAANRRLLQRNSPVSPARVGLGRNAWLVLNLGRENQDEHFRTIGREIALKYVHDLRY
jgi:hypothetical protein